MIFVPVWGWVGSLMTTTKRTVTNHFRPRLGMGWFLIYCFRTNCTQIFK
ncbi:unknown [Ruminococcus sp. CAG:108]|nr:unknown [Ruminococcus sp. CAG:108]